MVLVAEFKKLPKSEIELKIEIPAQELENFFQEALLSLGKNLEIKGFRKGQAPKEAVEKEIGSEKVLLEAANLAAAENYKKAVLEKEIEPISQPEVAILKLAKNNPFIFQIKVAVLPEIKLPDYQKIIQGVVKRKVLVEEKEVKDSLIWLQKSRAKFTFLSRPAQKGDFVEIEYESPDLSISQKIKDAFILGEGRFINNFEDNLAGMKAGEEKEFSLIFPQDYPQKEMAGKEAVFRVKMNTVQKMELPELNDSWAQSLGKFENLADLQGNLRRGLTTEKELAEAQRIREEILEKIAQKSKLEIPENLIESEKNHLFEDFKQKINQNLNISFEEYLKAIKQSEEDIKKSFSKEAEKKVRNFLLLKEIGKKEKISASDEETEAKLLETLKNYPNREKLDLARLRNYSQELIFHEKVFQRLESFVK